MKYTIEGFSVSVAHELGLSCEELVILRWFSDFWHTGKMTMIVSEDGKNYAWIDYKTVMRDIPVIQMSTKRLRDRFTHMVEVDVLTHQTIRQGGVYAYYGFGKRYIDLISITEPRDKTDGVWDEIVPTLGTKSSQPLGQNCPNKDYSTINKSTKDKDKGKEQEQTKIAFGEMENVYLTAEEYASLLVKMGDIGRQKYIDAVSLYKASKGKEYKSDYSACLQYWIKDGRPVENTAVVIPIPVEKPDLSTPEKIREAIFT